MKNLFDANLTLEQSIISTLGFFSTMKRPLTVKELHLYLWRKTENLENLCEYLSLLKAKKIISSLNLKIEERTCTYYTLSKTENIFEHYKANIKLRNKLLKKAKHIIHLINWIPYIEQIYLCNSLAFGASKPGSDIDLFIITKKNRLFFCRTFVTIILSIFKLRRHDEDIAEQICLSFYAEEQRLNLEKLKLEDDIYLIYWIANLKLLSSKYVYENIIEINDWILKFVPQLAHKWPKRLDSTLRIYPLVQFGLEMVLNIFRLSTLIQYISKRYQLKRARRKFSRLSPSAKNIIAEDMLKFHDKDRREYYRNQWIEVIKDII